LKNLSRDYIDLILLHNWDENWDRDIDYILKPLKDLKKK